MTEPNPTIESTRTKILAAAHRLFVEQGYHGTSMRQVADAAQIALGGIYNHFSSKEEIFTSVLDIYHPYREILSSLHAQEGETVENFVRRAATTTLLALERRPDFLNLMFVEIVEFNSQHIPQLYKKIFPQVTGLVQLFVSRQDSLKPIPVPVILRAFIGLFFSYYITEQLLAGQLPPEMQENALDHFVEIFLHGALSDNP